MSIPRTVTAAGSVVALSAALLGVVPNATARHQSRPTVKVTNPTISEHVGTAHIRVKVAHRTKKAIRIHFHTIAGSAHAGSDFVAKSGRVRIKKHHKSAVIKVRIVNDHVHEGTERFAVKLRSTAARLPKKRAHVTITDDDPAVTGTRLRGTITYHINQSEYFDDLEALGTPGSLSRLSTLTMHVSLKKAADGTWVDDGTGSWTYASTGNIWVIRGMGVEVAPDYPYACADNPLTYNFYKRTFWYKSAGHNTGPFVVPPSSFAEPALHQAFLTLSGYDPHGTGSPVLRVIAHIRGDRFETRSPDPAHICDDPNPMVFQGDDVHLDSTEVNSYHGWIPRYPDTNGLTASYDGSSLKFADTYSQSSNSLDYHEDTGHHGTEETDTYTVSGTLTLS